MPATRKLTHILLLFLPRNSCKQNPDYGKTGSGPLPALQAGCGEGWSRRGDKQEDLERDNQGA